MSISRLKASSSGRSKASVPRSREPSAPRGASKVLAERNPAVVAVGAWVEGGQDFVEHPSVHRIATVVYQCYSDVTGPDSVTMETFKPALTKLGKSIQLDPSPSTDVLRKIVRNANIQSNLYI